MKANATKSTPLGGAFWDGGAQTFIHKSTNGRWREILSAEEAAKYERGCTLFSVIKWLGVADGGAGIAPYYDLADKIPADVQALVNTTLADIKSGALVVELDVSAPTSD